MDEEPEIPITNRMLLARIVLMEQRLYEISHKMDQAMGAWMFVKILASIAVGLAIIYEAIYNHLK